MTVGDITRVLEAFAPLDIQESWDNSGLLIGTPEDQVHGVLVGFDCTPELIEEAVEKARGAAVPGDAVLLSPACASWGMFRNFEERGTRFKELVKKENQE